MPCIPLQETPRGFDRWMSVQAVSDRLSGLHQLRNVHGWSKHKNSNERSEWTLEDTCYHITYMVF